MLLESLLSGFFYWTFQLLGSITPVEVPSWDLGPAVGVILAMDAHLPMHEVLAGAGFILALDAAIFVFDTFDWAYKHLPFIS